MEDRGATALMLVTALISDLQAKRLVSSGELAGAIALMVARCLPRDEMDAAENAMAVLEGMTREMADV